EAQDKVAEPAKNLRDQGVSIHSIGVRDAKNSELLEIAGDWVRVHPIRDFDALQSLETTIQSQLCKGKIDCRTQVADIIFLVDCSSSITDDQFKSMLEFMQSLVNEVEVGPDRVRFGVITFSDDPKMNFILKQYSTKTEVRGAISTIVQTMGTTYTAKSLEFSMRYFDEVHGGRRAEGVPQILMVITDGEATDGVSLPEKSKQVRESGINIYGIGVKEANRKELEIMTGDTEKVFYADDFDALKALKGKILNALCIQTKPACATKKADLVVLVDGSDSISRSNFELIRQFMLNLVTKFTIDLNIYRIGMAQFSSNPRKEFHLNEHKNEAEVIKAIQGVKQLREGSMLGKGLEFMNSFFTASSGSRIDEYVPQNLVVITDGDSDDDAERAAQRLRNKNVRIFVVGIGSVGEHKMGLINIAGSPKRFFVTDFEALDNIRSAIFEEICHGEQGKK
ncbi:collagen alpha-6(VI) chain-like isoform X1, partial [Arapaima gigas]